MTSRSRTFVAVTAALLVIGLGLPASGASGPWGRTPRTVPTDPGTRVGKPLPAPVPVERDALSRALERGRVDEATYALERARTLFDLEAVRARFGAVRKPDPRSATLILRDLVARLSGLTPSQLRLAHALLARPTDGATDPQGDGYTVPEATPVCSTNGCVHYVTSTPDAPSPTDVDPANGIPDFVDETLATLDEVWTTEVTTYGYRPPKSDLTSVNNGGSALIDIYVTQLGDQGLYGYCTTDDPNADPASGYAYYDFSAYCVVDNDYAEFPPPSTGLPGLHVTLAHEFFHAVQYAYDALEDVWFMESTATWMEDEVYDGVNDNLQYLIDSPISTPDVPLDLNNGFNVYGDWIWPRFLVESSGGDATIVRQAWEKADASPTGIDQYGIKAYASVISSMGAKFRWAFADFGMYNDEPTALYEEGSSYPIPPYADKVKITRTSGGVSGRERLDHLTNRYVWFIPGRGVSDRAKLWVSMDGPAYRTGPEASVVVFLASGAVRFYPLVLNKKGMAEIVVPFKKGIVTEVDLVMTNASRRLKNGACWVDPSWTYSCAGFPKDDAMTYAYSALLLQ
ncbi:MAG: MXAN_6640 family putative metalloprotease [Solirubrobacterales bacterium]